MRLELHAINVAEGERIVAKRAEQTDAWANDFPFEGDVIAVTYFLRASAELGEQQPFGFYRIDRRSDGLAVGGIGFKSQPVDGCVEIGYGLAPSVRGYGYAAEAAAGLLTVATDHGLTKVVAETTLDNVASQRTLTRAGFQHVGTDTEVYRYEVILDHHAVR
jgi:RimJ/RimL family protein N-acetyltransferase